ncbi:hypothetical protein [Geitlerinema calcuttense]|uniref:Uncharacterized protein n=1 Tax=Geitlerinema calcuttense NRMC-F 0142 TaxID=2922238 RepID=A0ABT7LUY5_9CYAN|nr:hypothetical protein [Geitlerinema calcuttense]MDL5055884.1 hypothetical protein [Geitlerinema calcuttense NRMC-F 0142]
MAGLRTFGINPSGGAGGGMAIGGAITGADEGSVLFAGAGGILAQDKANFFWDDTANRLGIGLNTSLDAKLHILAGGATEKGLLIKLASAQSANAFEVQPNGSTTPLIFISSGGALRANSITDTAAGNLTISNGSGNSVFIQGGGDGGASVNFTRRFNIFTPALSINSPAQITANQNNYTFSGFGSLLRLSSDASRNITGLANTWGAVTNNAGDVLTIINIGSNDIVLKHQDAASTDTNRFLNSTGADITLTANQAADLFYDGTTQRWRVYKRN